MEFPMTNIQAMSLENARKNMVRARKELELARINDTHYRGVEYTPVSGAHETHGKFVYRGRTYTK
jgi:hypothetical protein